MRQINTSKLIELQSNTESIRNICIMAHVDHGKTTLTDSLLACNGIISQKLAGKLRYLDSRKDEQERGITMKSSVISVVHSLESRDYLVNVIDSPGHVDFSSEVSTAVRLCDGALILVDVVEGVCAQTIVALKQAWQENIKPVLVLNKVDRLIVEVKLNPLDAYLHLSQVLEKVNAVMAELFTKEVLEKDYEKAGHVNLNKEGIEELYDWNTGMEDADDSNLYFSPDQGNVIFASAADGWGFSIENFAQIYSEKVGFKKAVLNKTLWGDFYINNKLKRILRGAQEKAKKPLFVQLILENIWAVYEAAVIRKDKVAVDKIVNNLGLKLLPRDLKQTDSKAVLYAVMSNWLSLSNAVLDMACKKLPSPLELSETKVERLMLSQSRKFSSLPLETQNLKSAFLNCSTEPGAPIIIFVSKMFAVESSSLPQKRPKQLSIEELAKRRELVKQRINERNNLKEEINEDKNKDNLEVKIENPTSTPIQEEEKKEAELSFIAFARVYSGTVKKGQRLFVLGPKHDPEVALRKFPNGEGIDQDLTLKELKKGQYITSVEINHLYLLMGKELEILDEVSPGCIFGIGGLEDHILKSATISSTLACPPFTDVNLLGEPILRVAVESKHTCDMGALVVGLKLLNQADPCVQVLVDESGQHVIVTAGEVHLQRCLDDLRERFAKVEITASQPIVPFRETVIDPPKVDMVNEMITNDHSSHKADPSTKNSDEKGIVNQFTSNKKSHVKISAAPLPQEVIDIIDENTSLLQSIKKNEAPPDSSILLEFYSKLKSAFESNGFPPTTVDEIWSFGPKFSGPNILLNSVPHFSHVSFWSQFPEFRRTEMQDQESLSTSLMSSCGSSFVHGFQMATNSGPLCGEPMRGLIFRVHEWEVGVIDEETGTVFGPLSGQIMSAVKECCRKAFQAQPQRLMIAMYSSTIQVNAEVLGKLYAVLGKRGGRILHGDLQEGSTNFEVTAQLPVIESFNFADEVRRQTSGLALPQLVFSNWETLEIDPFWQPTTEEEYLHFGEKADTENRAKKYMNAVRKRKGLKVEEKLVEFGEKQRTLTRNK